jgi:HEAT repeat protein
MKKPDLRTDNAETDLAFREVVRKLAETTERLSSSEIAALSLASPEDARLFREYWAGTTAERKAAVLGRMLELAEDDPNLEFSPLYLVMLDDEVPAVRAGAVKGLWENEDPSLIRRLMPLMEDDAESSVRAAAAQALGKFVLLAEHGKIRVGLRDLLLSRLLGVFQNDRETNEVRRRALESVAYLSCPEVRQAIMDSYDSPDPSLRSSALFATGRNLAPEWLELLIDELSSDSPEHRFEAVVACGHYEDEQAVPQLIRLTDDPDPEIRLAAITSLGKIGGPDARSRLRELTESADEAVAEMAAQALQDMVSDDQVMELLQDGRDITGAG